MQQAGRPFNAKPAPEALSGFDSWGSAVAQGQLLLQPLLM